MYPALMIEYDCLSRNVENKEKYREIRDERLRLKKLKDKKQAPMKIVLNGTFGASKDKYNNLFDPRNANIVCVSGQLLLLDLIEKVEPFGQLIQSNTDGILVKIESEEMMQKYLEACDDWSKRTRLDLEHDEYVKVIQKDVNNYIIVDAKGKYKSKGAYVKELSKIDYDLPIINEALINYFTKDIPIEETINNCNELIKFQKIVKITRLFKYAIHGDKIIKEKILRVFASTDSNDNSVFKVKTEGKFEKISYTPVQCFINNEDVTELEVPDKLDRQYYIDMATDRMNKFLTNDKAEKKPKSDIKSVNAIIKSEVEEFLLNDESDSILEFIVNLKNSTTINKTQFNILCKLNYFSSYCKSKKMLKCFEIYSTITSRKTFPISDVELFGFTIEDMEKCYITKSETKYTSFDSDKLLNIMFDKLEDEPTTLKERLSYELQYYEKFKFTNNKFPADVYCVQEIIFFKDKSKPKFKLYSLKNGDILETRIMNSEIYIEAPIKEGFVIKADFNKKLKGRMIEGKWTTNNEYEFILKSYEVY